MATKPQKKGEVGGFDYTLIIVGDAAPVPVGAWVGSRQEAFAKECVEIQTEAIVKLH
jgi:hypothetical protein